MASEHDELKARKKEHLAICESDAAAFAHKTTGLEKYDFLHYALTEVDLQQIQFQSQLFGKKINFPFLISCMTGGADEADNINLKLAGAAAKLHVPLGLGSLRYALSTKQFDKPLQKIRERAGTIPLFGNIGAAQITTQENFNALKRLVRVAGLDAFVIHLNPLQELLQRGGEPNFIGVRQAVKDFVEFIGVPIVVKEVGAGLSARVAEELLLAGVQGIDVAGAGGTSWAAVEILRNKSQEGSEFWDWGNPTAYCISTIAKLKDSYTFTLIGSGGINSGFEAAKALALGANMIGSARIILQKLNSDGIEGVVALVKDWFLIIKNIMFLTGAQTLQQFDNRVLIRKEDFC